MTEQTHPHGGGRLLHAGVDLQDAEKVIILLHGRGASAADIIRLGDTLTKGSTEKIAFLAPQATNNTWYPVSGFAPLEQLTPWLESALMVIDDTIDTALDAGIDGKKIVLGGFSQGAMLSLEYASRGRRAIGGVVAFSGSVIGPVEKSHEPAVDSTGLPVFIGCGTNDNWIPVRAAERSAEIFTAAGANVDLRIYDGMDHIINQDEVEATAALIASV